MPDYDLLVSTLRELLPNNLDHAARYADDEGDMCTLVKSTFPDFLTTVDPTALPAGPMVLHLEVITLTAITDAALPRSAPADQCPKSNVRRQRQKPTLKSTWEDDRRDLEDLLQQFADEPVASKKNRKKKKKTRTASGSQGENQSSQEDHPDFHENHAEDTVENEVGALSDTDVNEQGAPMVESSQEVPVIAANIVANSRMVNVLTSPTSVAGVVDEVHVQDDVGEYATEDEFLPLVRSSSCPCLFTSGSTLLESGETNGASLVKQAWPFADLEAVAARLSSPPHLGDDVAESSYQAPPDSPAIPAALCTYMHQEVVWMPMLVSCRAAETYGYQSAWQFGQQVEL